VGLSALALVTSGAVDLAPASPSAARSTAVAMQVGEGVEGVEGLGEATTGTSSRALLLRAPRISRDSSRQALEDSTGSKTGHPGAGQGRERNGALKKLAASAEKAAGRLAENGWVLPVTRGVYHLTSRFGECSSLWAHCHTGLDFAAASGTPIHAVADGVVTETAYAGAYGNRTVMRLEDGTELWYCHQTAFATAPGRKVRAGQTIGYVGATGNTTGPHLHLEVRPGGGDPVDPFQALVVHGITP